MGQSNSTQQKKYEVTPVVYKLSPKKVKPIVNKLEARKKHFIKKYHIDIKLCKKLQPLTIYKKDGCPYCINAVQLCKIVNIKPIEKLTKNNEDFIKKTTSDYKYVPVIYCKNSKLICKKLNKKYDRNDHTIFIGGFNDLINLLSTVSANINIDNFIKDINKCQ